MATFHGPPLFNKQFDLHWGKESFIGESDLTISINNVNKVPILGSKQAPYSTRGVRKSDWNAAVTNGRSVTFFLKSEARIKIAFFLQQFLCIWPNWTILCYCIPESPALNIATKPKKQSPCNQNDTSKLRTWQFFRSTGM